MFFVFFFVSKTRTYKKENKNAGEMGSCRHFLLFNLCRELLSLLNLQM